MPYGFHVSCHSQTHDVTIKLRGSGDVAISLPAQVLHVQERTYLTNVAGSCIVIPSGAFLARSLYAGDSSGMTSLELLT